jgi:hypothetical protein
MADEFQCCLVLESGIIFIGTTSGKVFESQLIEEEKISNFEFKSNINYESVLKDDLKEILTMDGKIRSIERLNNEEIIILSHYGGIMLYNLNSKTNQLINKEFSSARSNKWRLLVIEEDIFIIVGNYGLVEIWYKEDNQFQYKVMTSSKHASFCIDWINREEKTILINNFSGETFIYQFENLELIEQQQLSLDWNLQKSIIFEDYLVAVNFYGSVSIYNMVDEFKKVTEFQIDSSTGNYVQKSQELNRILIGSDRKLLILAESPLT